MTNHVNQETQTQETQIALIVQRQDELDKHLEANDGAIAALQAERNKALIWGIITLGTAVIAMGTWIFKVFANIIVSGHIK